jgi:hypothetical protein
MIGRASAEAERQDSQGDRHFPCANWRGRRLGWGGQQHDQQSALIVRIKPTPGQGFSRREKQVSLGKGLGILQFLATMQASGNGRGKGVKQLLQIEHFNQTGVIIVMNL